MALAQYTSSNRDVTTPNTGPWGAAGVSLGNTFFQVQGLQGVGRFAAGTVDASSGETIGSISDMQVTGWTRNASTGTYAGTLHTLPDRGYNAGTVFSNYAARLNNFTFEFTPHTSNTATTLQNQLQLNFANSQRFTYDHDSNPNTPGAYTTGLLPTGRGTVLGNSAPVVTGSTTLSDGTVAGRLTLDSEGLIMDPRPSHAGAGWVSDEYGPNIYRFNANKEIIGTIRLPDSLIPHVAGVPDFAADPPGSGRRNNQGMEGIAISPDGTKLYAMLQSATVQDSGAGNVGRSNTRVLVYDISSSDTPTSPISQHLVQLPRVDDNGGTPAVNRTAAQSAILALGDDQLLVLARDGNGRGAAGTPVFKSTLLVDLNGGSDLNDVSTINFPGGAAAPGGSPVSGVVPAPWIEALNLLDAEQLAKLGLNANLAGAGDANSLAEKWEALTLLPALDAENPDDYFLFVGNDNDFNVDSLVPGGIKTFDANGVLQGYTGTVPGGVDNMILVYRVTISQPAFIPEPSSLALLVPLSGVVLFRRRRA